MGTKRKYRLVGQLGTNRRLASVSVEAALLYLLALPYGDREGRLPGDPGDLIDEVATAHARRHGWSEQDVDGWIAELVGVGLLRAWQVGGVKVVAIERWWDHQHPSRLAEEARSEFPDPEGWVPPERWIPPPPHPPQEQNLKRGVGEPNLMSGRNRTEPDGPGQVRTVQNGQIPPTPAPLPHDANHGGDSWSISDEASRIRLALVPIAPAMWTPGGSESELIHRYAREGTCRRWPDGKLAAHLADLHGKIQAKRGKAPDMAYLLRQINADWDPSPEKKATKEIPPARPGDPFGYDGLTGRPYHPGA